MAITNVRATLTDLSHKDISVKKFPLVSTNTLCKTDDLMELAAAGLACYHAPEGALTGAVAAGLVVPFLLNAERDVRVTEEQIRARRISSLFLTGAASALFMLSRDRVPAGMLGAWGMLSLVRTGVTALSPSQQLVVKIKREDGIQKLS